MNLSINLSMLRIFLLSSFFLSSSFGYGMDLKKRPLGPRTNECSLCHIKRTKPDLYIPLIYQTKKEHFEIEILHGNLKKSCSECHDINNSNKLYPPASFNNTSLLCGRCHLEHFTEWKNGLHGKKTDSWKSPIAYQCIDCHNPHSVSFKKMEASPAPILRKFN